MSVLVCPKCSRKHSVNPAKLPEAKVVFARCKACAHKFPVQVEQVLADLGAGLLLGLTVVGGGDVIGAEREL